MTNEQQIQKISISLKTYYLWPTTSSSILHPEIKHNGSGVFVSRFEFDLFRFLQRNAFNGWVIGSGCYNGGAWNISWCVYGNSNINFCVFVEVIGKTGKLGVSMS